MKDRKSTRLNSSHSQISYAVFCLKKKKVKVVRYTIPLSARLRGWLDVAALVREMSRVYAVLFRGCAPRFGCLEVSYFYFFFFNDTATTEIYTLSLHDALPISCVGCSPLFSLVFRAEAISSAHRAHGHGSVNERSEEHTSELQSQSNLVCRLLLEKKKSQGRAIHDPVVGTSQGLVGCGGAGT